jgi:hypothetical protein
MQHFSDCDGSAMFRVSSKQIAIWTTSYQNPEQFDLVQTSSKFEVLTHLGGGPLLTVLGVLSQITNTTITTNTTSTTYGVQQFSAVSQGYNGGARCPPSTVALVLILALALVLVLVPVLILVLVPVLVLVLVRVLIPILAPVLVLALVLVTPTS